MEERDPGYDDWFDEPESPTQEASRGGRGLYDGVEDVWVLPEDGPRRPRGAGDGTIVVAGLVLTRTQAAIVAAAVLALVFGLLAAAGVFSSSGKSAAPPITSITTPPAVNPSTSTPTVSTTAATAPTSSLKPGDTGKQVKLLQQSLNALGFSVGKPDGDYGPNTQSAVEQFQNSKGLTADGVVGPATLSALQKALSG